MKPNVPEVIWKTEEEPPEEPPDPQNPPNLPKKPPGKPPKNKDLECGITSPPHTPPKPGTKVKKLTEFFNKLGGNPTRKKQLPNLNFKIKTTHPDLEVLLKERESLS